MGRHIGFRMLGYREHQVLSYAQRVIAERGVAPTYNMIRNHTGIATRGEVARIVANLERRGMLKRTGAARVRSSHVSFFVLTPLAA